MLSKLKESIKKKKIIKEINRDFEDLRHEIAEREKTKRPEEKSLKTDTYQNTHKFNDIFFYESWGDDKTFNDKNKDFNISNKRRQIFKDIIKDLKILKKYSAIKNFKNFQNLKR